MKIYLMLGSTCLLLLIAVPAASAKGDPIKGKEIWLRTCAVCHTKNPSWGNFNAPAVTGSSRALLEARVMYAAYPPGYKPKKPTKKMLPIPSLKPHIDDLHAFLNQ